MCAVKHAAFCASAPVPTYNAASHIQENGRVILGCLWSAPDRGSLCGVSIVKNFHVRGLGRAVHATSSQCILVLLPSDLGMGQRNCRSDG